MSPFIRRLAISLVLAACASALASCTQDTGPGDVTDERWLEARLIAPCCWRETLDVHESPIAEQLRSEVHARLAHHERPQAIEDDLAARYGEAIRALPRGRDPRVGLAATVILAVLGLGVVLAGILRRWVARPEPHAAPFLPAPRDAFDDRLDEELRDID
jgi:cytochrome c-type biogenesis protein CcmH